MLKEKLNALILRVLLLFVFAILSFYVFNDKLELYKIENQILSVIEVLFGATVPTTYNGQNLMPNNSSSAFAISSSSSIGYKPKAATFASSNYGSQVTSYAVLTSTTEVSSESSYLYGTSSENSQSRRATKRRANDNSGSNTFARLNLKLFSVLSNRSNVSNLEDIASKEPFSDMSASKPFKANYTDPDPEAPTGNPLPLENDLLLLLLMSGIYALFKYHNRLKRIRKNSI